MLLLLACSPTASVAPGPAPSTDSGAVTTPDTPPRNDSAAPYDSADPIEYIEGPPSSKPGLCEVVLSCDGPIEDEPKIGCEMSVTSDTGIVQYSGRAGLDLRGRSSAAFPKPQYAAELWDGDDEAISANLMGMGGESDWILNGAYIDRVLFRNTLAYDSFRAAAADNYAAEIAYCTLTLDGEWVGIYHLTERIKRDDDRVDLEADDSGETFLVKLDDETGIAPNSTGYGTWQLVYPRAETLSAAASAAIAGRLNGWQSAIVHSPQTIPDWLDIDSMIDFILIQELTRNNDAYYLSIHISRAPGEGMRMIPWDSDLSLGQPSYNDNENPAGWVAYRPDFIANMADIPGFSQALAERWRQLRADAWSDAALNTRIDGYRETMGERVYENFEVWPIADIEFGWSGVDYLYEIESYDAELERVRAWLPQRLAWVDANIDAW